jgi:hypothetical protein
MLQSNRGEYTGHIFGLTEWIRWFDEMARAIFGLSGTDFEAAFRAGAFVESGPAADLGSVLPLIERLKERARAA